MAVNGNIVPAESLFEDNTPATTASQPKPAGKVVPINSLFQDATPQPPAPSYLPEGSSPFGGGGGLFDAVKRKLLADHIAGENSSVYKWNPKEGQQPTPNVDVVNDLGTQNAGVKPFDLGATLSGAVGEFDRAFTTSASSALRGLQGIENVVYDAVGENKEIRDALDKTGIVQTPELFDRAADSIDNFAEKHFAKLPDNGISNVYKGAVGLIPLAAQLYFTPEIEIPALAKIGVGTVPKLATNFAINGFGQEYERSGSLGKSIEQGAIGGATGAIYHGLGDFAGDVSGALKEATGSNTIGSAANPIIQGLGFGSFDAMQQYATTGQVNWSDVATNAGLGGAFGILDFANGVATKRTKNFFATDPTLIKAANESPKTIEDLKQQAHDLGTQADEATDPKEKLKLVLQQNATMKVADIKQVTDNITANPKEALDAIKNDETLNDQEKQYYTDKINKVVKENPVKTPESINNLLTSLNLKSQKDATKEGKQSENDKQEHIGTTSQPLSTETGGSNSTEQGGEIKPPQTSGQVEPKRVLHSYTDAKGETHYFHLDVDADGKVTDITPANEQGETQGTSKKRGKVSGIPFQSIADDYQEKEKAKASGVGNIEPPVEQPKGEPPLEKGLAGNLPVPEKPAPEPKIKPKDLLKSDPQSLHEDILQHFVGGGKINREDFTHDTGFGTKGRNADMMAKAHFIDFKNKSYGLDLLAKDLANKWNIDEKDAREEIINTLTNNTKADMINKLADLQKKQSGDKYQEEYEKWHEQVYGQIPEDEHQDVSEEEKNDILNKVFPLSQEQAGETLKNLPDGNNGQENAVSGEINTPESNGKQGEGAKPTEPTEPTAEQIEGFKQVARDFPNKDDYDQQLKDHLGDKYNDYKDIANKAFEDAGKEPPINRVDVSKLPPEKRPLSVLKRVMDNTTDEKVKKGLQSKGIDYIPNNQQEASDIGRSIINEMGVEEAAKASAQHQFGYGICGAIDGQVADHYRKEGEKAGTQEEKDALAEKYNNQLKFIAEQAKNFGQYNAQLAQTYQEWGFAKTKEVDDFLKQKAAKKISKVASEETLQSVHGDFTKTPEFQKAVSDRVKELLGNRKIKQIKERTQKAVDFLEGLKTTKSKFTQAAFIPPIVHDGAITAMQLVVKAGGTLAETVQAGINYINKKFDGQWNEDDFRNTVTAGLQKELIENEKSDWTRLGKNLEPQESKDKLKRQNEITNTINSLKGLSSESRKTIYNNMMGEMLDKKLLTDQDIQDFKNGDKDLGEIIGTKSDETKKNVLDYIQQQVKNEKGVSALLNDPAARKDLADKLKNKLKGMTDAQRAKFVNDALDAKKKGTLDYDKFKELLGDALGVEKMTPELQKHIIDLNDKLNDLTKAQQEFQPGKDITQEKIDDFAKKTKAAGDASKEFQNYIADRPTLGSTLRNFAKMATLTPKNIGYHILFQAFKQPFESAKSLTQTGLDYGIASPLGWKAKNGIKENFFYKQIGYFYSNKSMPSAINIAFKNIVGEQAQSSYFDKPMDYLKPIDAAIRVKKSITGEESQSLQNNIADGLTAMPHSITAVLERGFQFGFTLFQLPAERAQAESIARQKGYSGMDKVAFLMNPDETSKASIIEAGKKAALKSDVDVLDILNKMTGGADIALKNANPVIKGIWGGVKFAGTTVQPFVKIPLNAALIGARLAVPEISFAESLYHAIKSSAATTDAERDFHRNRALSAAGWGIVGMTSHVLYNQWATAGIIINKPTANSDVENARIRELLTTAQMPEQSFNWSAFQRYYSGRKYDAQPNDIIFPLHTLGAFGTALQISAARYDKETPQEQEKHATYFSNLWQDSKNAFTQGLSDGVYSGTAAFSEALATGRADNILMSMTNVAENVVEPAALENLIKTEQKAKPDYTDAKTFDKLIDETRFRFGLKSKFPQAVDPFGQKEEVNPKGTNPLVYYNLLPVQQLTEDKAKLNAAMEYMRERNIKLTPSYESKSVKLRDGKKAQLNPEQYNDLKTFVGQSRLNYIRRVNFNDTKEHVDRQMIEAYKEGELNGKSIFNAKYHHIKLDVDGE